MKFGTISWPAIVFMGGLLVMSAGISVMSARGAFLPKTDENSKISLRNATNRRSHFFSAYAFGK